MTFKLIRYLLISTLLYFWSTTATVSGVDPKYGRRSDVDNAEPSDYDLVKEDDIRNCTTEEAILSGTFDEPEPILNPDPVMNNNFTTYEYRPHQHTVVETIVGFILAIIFIPCMVCCFRFLDRRGICDCIIIAFLNFFDRMDSDMDDLPSVQEVQVP